MDCYCLNKYGLITYKQYLESKCAEFNSLQFYVYCMKKNDGTSSKKVRTAYII